MHRTLLFFFAMFFTLLAKSQNFNYSFAKDSVAWQELNSQTILNTSNSAWNFCYKIPIGFPFNYLGRNFDSLQIETNGYLVFGSNRSYAFAAFNGFGDRLDSVGNHSVLGYELDGSSGNHILKIQFKNSAQGNSSQKYLSYQVWLYESGNKVEMHVGTNNYRSLITSYVFAPDTTGHLDSVLVHSADSVAVMIGLLNMNMNTTVRGYLLRGGMENPQAQELSDSYPELSHLTIIPHSGYTYTFTPGF